MRNVYTSIYDCPIRIYQRVFEFDDIELLVKNKYIYWIQKHFIDLAKILDEIVLQLIQEFGVSRKYEVKFYKERDLLRLKLEYLTGDLSREVEILIKERELSKLNEKVPTVHDLRKENASMHRILSQWAGCDTRLLTIFEYYNLIKDYEQYIEKERQADNKRKGGYSKVRKVG